jgi:hypothetical protein
MIAITYIGKRPGFVVSIENREYEFERQKSLGIGKRKDEVLEKHARILSNWKDKRGKKIFFPE